VVPFGTFFGAEPAVITDLNVGLLFVLAMASLQVYGIVLAGYAAGSNYPLLGAVRSSAQMISYEIAQGLSLIGVIMYAGTLSTRGIVDVQSTGALLGFLPNWFVIPQFPMFVVFVLAGLAETNRAPFDLPEAESELVGGYHTEYSGFRFALFFLAEYINMIVVSAVTVTVFFGGPDGPVFGFLPWLWPTLWFLLKLGAFLFLFIWIRATLPRFRFDTLMALGWKVLIPVTLVWIAVTAVSIVIDFGQIRSWLFVAAGALLVLLLAGSLISAATDRQRRPVSGGSS
jgi:NADH-quinone oxidoreductase subunit H